MDLIAALQDDSLREPFWLNLKNSLTAITDH